MPADEPRAELFRPAAVAAHRGPQRALAELPSPRRLTTAMFWAVAAAVALLVTAAFAIHIDETSAGVWRAGPQPATATVALPIGSLDRLRAGELVTLRSAGPPVEATITTVLNPVPATQAQAAFARPLPGALRGATAVALVEVRTVNGEPTADGGTATVLLGRRSLVAELVPALRHDRASRG